MVAALTKVVTDNTNEMGLMGLRVKLNLKTGRLLKAEVARLLLESFQAIDLLDVCRLKMSLVSDHGLDLPFLFFDILGEQTSSADLVSALVDKDRPAETSTPQPTNGERAARGTGWMQRWMPTFRLPAFFSASSPLAVAADTHKPALPSIAVSERRREREEEKQKVLYVEQIIHLISESQSAHCARRLVDKGTGRVDRIGGGGGGSGGDGSGGDSSGWYSAVAESEDCKGDAHNNSGDADISTEQSRQASERWVVLHDVDDTLMAALRDGRLPRKTVYPGCKTFARELSNFLNRRGEAGDGKDGVDFAASWRAFATHSSLDTVFLTARPSFLRKSTFAVLREHGIDASVVLAGASVSSWWKRGREGGGGGGRAIANKVHPPPPPPNH